MNTKYGGLPDDMLVAYVNGLVGKVYKILPLKEKKSDTLDKYLKRFLRELHGEKDLIFELRNNQDFITLLGILQHLIDENDMDNYRSDVFEAIRIIKRMRSALGGIDNDKLSR